MWNVTSVISACIHGAPQMVFAPPVLRGTGRLTPLPKKRQFKTEWLLTRSWLRYDASRGKMWCIACQQYPQLGHSIPFVQGTSKYSTVQYNIVQDGTRQYKYSTGRDSVVQFITVQ